MDWLSRWRLYSRHWTSRKGHKNHKDQEKIKWQRKLIPVHPSMTWGLVRFCSIVTKFLTQMGKLMEEGSVWAHSFRGFSPWRHSSVEQSILHSGGQEAEWSHCKKGPGQIQPRGCVPGTYFPYQARSQFPPLCYLPVIHSYFSSFLHHPQCPAIGDWI